MTVILILLFIGALVYFPNRASTTASKVILDTVKVVFIILIPVSVFLLSMFLAPEWKGQATFGAIDLLIVTKILLLPFVVWAVISLYTVEVVHPKNKDVYWLMLGLFSGLLISMVLIIYGLILYNEKLPFLLICIALGYIPMWYITHFWSLLKVSKLDKLAYFYTLLCQLPFWGVSIYGATKFYEDLPNNPPECFVATASSNGYTFITGNSIQFCRNGSTKNVSRQMIRFWMLEEIWKWYLPFSHKYFREFYNLWGKRLAVHIASPFVASMVYVFLKPFELFALLVIILNKLLK